MYEFLFLISDLKFYSQAYYKYIGILINNCNLHKIFLDILLLIYSRIEDFHGKT